MKTYLVNIQYTYAIDSICIGIAYVIIILFLLSNTIVIWQTTNN